MKPLLASLLTLRLGSVLALSLLAACGTLSTPAPNAPTLTPTPNWTDLSPFRDGLVDPSVLDKMQGASVYHIELTIDENLTHVTGTEEVRYTNREAAPLNEVEFRLFPNLLGGSMNVGKITVNGELVPAPKYRLENSLMIVPLTKPLAVGESITIAMTFDDQIPTDPELNYGVLASTNGVLTLAHAYPMIAVYDDEGWNAEIPPQSGDLTYADMSFFLIQVTAPKDLVIVGSGIESARETESSLKVWNVAAGPARDLFLAAGRDFEITSQQIGRVTVNSYAPPSAKEGSEAALEVAVRALETFSEQYAPYPYTELDVIATPTLALGVEYPGAVAIADRLYSNDAYSARTSSVRESTVAHEVGHQWFYNLVGNDQLDEPWLDESLAQFAAWEYYKINFGAQAADEFKATFISRLSRVSNASMGIGQPVAAYSNLEYSAIVYGRGPLFFMALQEKMGDAAFEAFLKDYASTYSWEIATTDGLKSLAEKHCNCDLTPLFEEWIY